MGSYRVSVELDSSFKDAHQKKWNRKRFFSWAWRSCQNQSLVGIHEGSVVCEGSPSDAFLDSAAAPLDRDWVGQLEKQGAIFYFSRKSGADFFREELEKSFPQIPVSNVFFEENRDWNAEWKKSFTSFDVPPWFRVTPPWEHVASCAGLRTLIINPGSAFGTGTHETTQLCLQALGRAQDFLDFKIARILDFGAGSGILSLACAKFGAKKILATEIDGLAHENFYQNCELNHYDIELEKNLPPHRIFDLIVANVLKGVLLDVSRQLVGALAPKGLLILSGLLEKDLEEVEKNYNYLLQAQGHIVHCKKFKKNDWFSLVFQQSPIERGEVPQL